VYTVFDMAQTLVVGNRHDELQRILYDMAQRIFNNITPREQKPAIAKEDVDYALNLVTDVVHADNAFDYLVAEEGVYMRKLVLAIESGMRDVLRDNAITVTDVPAVMRMIKEIGQSINQMHAKRDAFVQIGIHTLLPMVEVIVCLVTQMIVPTAQYALARSIISVSFDLLSTNVQPLVAKHCGWLSRLCCIFGQPDMSQVR